MKPPPLPCAVYTRKSSEEGLEQGFNSLDAQREACAAFVLSQKAQGWQLLATAYDDGGYSGGNTERPALQRLLADIAARKLRIVVVYKVDRLTRSLADFAKLVELFDAHEVSFVSVTQQFNTTSSMGRLTLNVLLSFAQFEREVTGERIRDKIAASKRKGMWMGGIPPVGYRAQDRTLAIDPPQAERIREVFRLYLELGCVRRLQGELGRRGWLTPPRKMRRANAMGDRPFSRGHLYRILGNPIYLGQIRHKGEAFPGQHPAIVDEPLWQAVQVLLRTNQQGQRKRSNAAAPSLLAGLLVDHEGQRLTPSHAQKGARRYHYYVRPTDDLADRNSSKALRWPARELDEAVLRALTGFLKDRLRLAALIGKVDAQTLRRRLDGAAVLAEQLVTESTTTRIELVQRLVARIALHPDHLEIHVRCNAIRSDEEPPPDGPTVLIEVPIQLRRCGMAVRLIVAAQGPTESEPDPKLIALLVKAQDWLGRLTSGRAEGIRAIAQQEKVTSSYVTRVVYLGCLAPDIVEQIAQGRQPPELNAERLIRMAPLPLAWQEQQSLLGLS